MTHISASLFIFFYIIIILGLETIHSRPLLFFSSSSFVVLWLNSLFGYRTPPPPVQCSTVQYGSTEDRGSDETWCEGLMKKYERIKKITFWKEEKRKRAEGEVDQRLFTPPFFPLNCSIWANIEGTTTGWTVYVHTRQQDARGDGEEKYEIVLYAMEGGGGKTLGTRRRSLLPEKKKKKIINVRLVSATSKD